MLTTTISRNDYALNGVTVVYPYTYRIFAAVDLQVIRRSAAGVETVLSYPADYTVSGVGNTSGGAVTLVSAGTAGDTLTLRRNAAITQATDLSNQGRYAPADIEAALDRLTGIDQQQQDQLDRSLKLPASLTPIGRALTLTPTAGKVVTGDGTGFTMTSLDSSAVSLPGGGRTVTTLSAYLANNALFHVKDFGALCNNVFDDAPAFRLAYTGAVAAGGGTILYSGQARWASVVSGAALPIAVGGIELVGDNTEFSRITLVGGITGVKIAGNIGYVRLRNTQFRNTGAKPAGSVAIRIEQGAAAYRPQRIYLDNVRIEEQERAVSLGRFSYLSLTDCHIVLNTHGVSRFATAADEGGATDLIAATEPAGASDAVNAGWAYDLKFNNCVISQNQNNVYLHSVADVVAVNSNFDQATNLGFALGFDNTSTTLTATVDRGVVMTDCIMDSNAAYGLFIRNRRFVQLSNVLVSSGRAGATTGAVLRFCQSVQYANLSTINCGLDGLWIDRCGKVDGLGLHSYGNVGQGLRLQAFDATSQYRIMGATLDQQAGLFMANQAGGLTIDGAFGQFWFTNISAADYAGANAYTLATPGTQIFHTANCRMIGATAAPFQSTTADSGDASVVMTLLSLKTVRFDTALTANRTLTLPPNADSRNGDRVRVARTGLGAFTLTVQDVAATALKVIPNSTAAFVEAEFNGTNWKLVGYGTL